MRTGLFIRRRSRISPSPSTPNRNPESMNQNQTESKPASVEEPREKGLDETPCSAGEVMFPEKYCEGVDHTVYCPAWSRNWPHIDRGLRMAALNGTPTKADNLKYCPWCGGLLAQRISSSPNYTGMISESVTAGANGFDQVNQFVQQ